MSDELPDDPTLPQSAAPAPDPRIPAFARAKELGIKTHHKWGLSTIEQAIAAAEAALAKPVIAAPPPQPETPMATVAQTAEEIEHDALMAEADRLRISSVIPKKASVEAIREHIERHMAAKSQEQQILAAQAAQKAAAGPVDMVRARVLKMGDGKISRGIHIPGKGDLKHAFGEIITVERKIAVDLENRGYAEIQNVSAA